MKRSEIEKELKRQIKEKSKEAAAEYEAGFQRCFEILFPRTLGMSRAAELIVDVAYWERQVEFRAKLRDAIFKYGVEDDTKKETTDG